jgi:hypothetical protein
MLAPTEELFCADCQRNQIIVAQIAADYLPDEDDPEYARLEADWDRYRAELEGRYPQVCKHCKERVEGQLRNTGYMAKADHLRRIMERSEQKRYIAQTPRQIWTLRFITLAKWTYIASYLVQMLWHVFGYIMATEKLPLSRTSAGISAPARPGGCAPWTNSAFARPTSPGWCSTPLSPTSSLCGGIRDCRTRPTASRVECAV